MTWTRFDDGWGDRSEVLALSLAARWHLSEMIRWCSRTERYDGRIRLADARRCSDIDDPNAALTEIVSADHAVVEDDGAYYRLVNIEEHVPPPHMRDDRRKQGQRERQQRHRKRVAAEKSDPDPNSPDAGGVTRDVTRDTGTGRGGTSLGSSNEEPREDGSRSVGGSGGKVSKRRGSTEKPTRLPQDWWPGDHTHDWFRKACPNLNRAGLGKVETEKFCRYWWSKSKNATKINWEMTWQNWMVTAERDIPSTLGTRFGTAGSRAKAAPTTERVAALDDLTAQYLREEAAQDQAVQQLPWQEVS